MKRICVLLAVIVAVGFALMLFVQAPAAQAQSGRRQPARPAQSFETRFWNWLQKAEYKSWAPVPGKTGDPYPGESPHGAFLKMYLNRKAVGNFKELPHGSILVKENYGKDAKTLMAVTVMYRAQKGYDPKNFDWYWVKYNADGTVARTPPDKGSKPISGRFQSCISCHGEAGGGDFAFVNDE